MSKELTPRNQDYSQWYNDLVLKGGLADYSAVRGCMVIKPYGLHYGRICKVSLIRCLKKQDT